MDDFSDTLVWQVAWTQAFRSLKPVTCALLNEFSRVFSRHILVTWVLQVRLPIPRFTTSHYSDLSYSFTFFTSLFLSLCFCLYISIFVLFSFPSPLPSPSICLWLVISLLFLSPLSFSILCFFITFIHLLPSYISLLCSPSFSPSLFLLLQLPTFSVSNLF